MSPAPALGDLDHLPGGVAVWDGSRRLAFANRPFREALGIIELAVAPGLDLIAYLEAAAATGELVLPDGAAAWITTEAAAFGHERTVEQAMADGRTIEIVQRPTPGGGMTVWVQDVTARRRGEATLRRAKDLAEATDQTKSRFLRAANHDLRQPLATLKILIYNCMSETDEANRGELLHAMDIAVAIMEDLLGALLQIGQLDAGKIVPRITTFQVLPLLQRLELQFRHQAEEKGLRLRVVGARGSLNTDKALLERIVSNFVANAVRYTEVGGVLVGCRRDGPALRIEVWDTGRGIGPDQHRAHLRRVLPGARRKAGQAARPWPRAQHRASARRPPGSAGHGPLAAGSGLAVRGDVPIGNVWHSEIGEPEISEMIGGEFAGLPVLLLEDDEVLRDADARFARALGDRGRHTAGNEAQARELIAGKGLRPDIILTDYSPARRSRAPIVVGISTTCSARRAPRWS